MISDTDYILWGRLRDKLIKIHPTLTKSDLILRNGTISEILKTISSKLGITVKELKEEIDKL